MIVDNLKFLIGSGHDTIYRLPKTFEGLGLGDGDSGIKDDDAGLAVGVANAGNGPQSNVLVLTSPDGELLS